MKKQNAKRALVLSVLSLLLCCSMLVGTTFAWFTDSVTSGNNVIASGNLDVELEYYNGTAWEKVDANTNVFKTDALWEPGYTEVVYLKVSNLGTLALKYKLGINVADETGSVNVNNEAFNLSDYIQVGIVKGLDETKRFATREEARGAQFEQDKLIKEGYVTVYIMSDARVMGTSGADATLVQGSDGSISCFLKVDDEYFHFEPETYQYFVLFEDGAVTTDKAINLGAQVRVNS